MKANEISEVLIGRCQLCFIFINNYSSVLSKANFPLLNSVKERSTTRDRPYLYLKESFYSCCFLKGARSLRKVDDEMVTHCYRIGIGGYRISGAFSFVFSWFFYCSPCCQWMLLVCLSKHAFSRAGFNVTIFRTIGENDHHHYWGVVGDFLTIDDVTGNFWSLLSILFYCNNLPLVPLSFKALRHTKSTLSFGIWLGRPRGILLFFSTIVLQ